MKARHILFFLLPFLYTLTGCAQEVPTPDGQRPMVRVRLLEHQQQITIAAASPPIIRVGSDPAARELRIPPNTPILVTLTATGWRIGSAEVGSGRLILQARSGGLSLNKHSYRGALRLVPISSTQFDVINDLDVDSYLKGVLPSELFANWEMEAYKAQAIVARTYALYEARTAPAGRDFDLYSDTRSQAYQGMDVETAKSRQAVDETAGIVVAYGPPGKERIFKAYFSACCGGIGQSAQDVFGGPDIPPLAARSVGSMCAQSPNFSWRPVTIEKQELTRRIKLWATRRGLAEQNMAKLVRIDIMTANPYGRPSRFALTDSNNVRYSLNSEDMRHAIDTDAQAGSTANSSYFTPIDNGSSITLANGHGHGHGVGMCQWCAQCLALRGTRHEDIVIWSFPQSKLVRAY